MKAHDEVVSLGLSTADIAWPVVLVMCVALILAPFVLLFVARHGVDPDDTSG